MYVIVFVCLEINNCVLPINRYLLLNVSISKPMLNIIMCLQITDNKIIKFKKIYIYYYNVFKHYNNKNINNVSQKPFN